MVSVNSLHALATECFISTTHKF
uniref:Uncharacterized protein n=1 Tax=Anguilla anguilla TaxID=7936 RepID=A0A0E9PDD2_ANGAN